MIAVMAEMAATAARAEYDEMVRAEARRLFGVAFSILRDRGDAEDAVQETMVKAWRSWGSLKDPSKRRPWLMRICVNHCITRKRRLRLSVISMDDTVVEPRDPRATEAFDADDPDLERACGLLTPLQRAVITLHYRHGYSLDECATYIGRRPGTVRSHLNRALTTLRKELSHE